MEEKSNLYVVMIVGVIAVVGIIAMIVSVGNEKRLAFSSGTTADSTGYAFRPAGYGFFGCVFRGHHYNFGFGCQMGGSSDTTGTSGDNSPPPSETYTRQVEGLDD